MNDETAVLEKIYLESVRFFENPGKIKFSQAITVNIDALIQEIDKNKSLVSALVTSLLTKICTPAQDIRLHRTDFEGGYSARSLDANVTAPFFKKYFPKYANKESGFLTMSTRERIPWTKDAGQSLKIRNKTVKNSFLDIIDAVETKTVEASQVLVYLFYKLHILSLQHKMIFDETIETARYTDILNIQTILAMMEKHFAARLSSRLPVIAMYSLYQLLLSRIEMYKGKILRPLNTHTSSDKHGYGDIEIWNSDNTPFEMIEIKHNIPIDRNLIFDVVKKSENTVIERYYILTTAKDNFISKEEEQYIHKFILKIKHDTGIDIIPNGIYPSMKYYLRFVADYKQFITAYTENLIADANNSTEVQQFHITEWKAILKEYSI
ncbi:MAG: restriction endonuclease, SacI family [Spirochaetaceae bacterium]|jgi:DNA (cytosine-5)-methyltransferase 1|nr:restriction endonuclease, SacI family [Spirochaetaceae bacterium]